MAKYHPLTNAYAKWVFKLINRYDWGHLHRGLGHPIPRLTNDDYNTCLRGEQWWSPHRFTRTQLQRHLTNDQTYYFRAANTKDAHRLLIALDIDAKGDDVTEQDAEATARFISKSIHRHAYFEPSTNGKGRHVFLVVDRGEMKLSQFRAMLTEYASALRQLIQRAGCKAKLDRICGTPTLITYPNGQRTVQDGNRGVFCKLPRLPNGWSSLEQLQQAPLVTIKGIRWTIERAHRKNRHAIPADTTYRDTINMFTSANSGLCHRLVEELPVFRADGDALKRMHFACNLFRLQHLRLPYNSYELSSFYEMHRLHTGNDEKNRRIKRASSVLRFQETVFPENEASLRQLNFYLDLVKQYVTPEIRRQHQTDRDVNNEDLAIVLYTIERNSLKTAARDKWQGTTGNESIIQMFRALKAAGRTVRGCQLNKAVAAKKMLIASGLVTQEDGTWVYGGPGKGICKKFGLGEHHPKVNQFQQLTAQIKQKRKELEDDLARGREFVARPIMAVMHVEMGEDAFDDILGELPQIRPVTEPVAESLPEQGQRCFGNLEERMRTDDLDGLGVEIDLAVVGAAKDIERPVGRAIAQRPNLNSTVADHPDIDRTPPSG